MDNNFSKYKEIYLHEFSSHMEEMSKLLLELEKDPAEDHFKQMLHLVHTLKGNAATMKYEQTANLCHALEDLFTNIRDKKVSMKKAADLLFKALDILHADLQELSISENEINTEAMVVEIRDLLIHPQKDFHYTKPRHKTLASAMEKIRTINIKVEHLDSLMKLSEELLVNRLNLVVISAKLNNAELTQTIDSLEHLITELQYNIMQARLLPLRVLFARFPRMIRDLAKQQNKEVILQTEGSDIELDRALLDELAEALTHLIRNAIDHGIEPVNVRLAANKTPQGTLKLIATRTKESANIELSDDGAGLNWQAIKEAAIKKKLVTPTASMQEVKQSLFKGLSTSKQITAVSGRGLGLAIAKQKIESIGGTLTIESKEAEGLACLIKIPLTLAVIKVLFVKVNQKIYALPLEHVKRLITVSSTQIKGLFDERAIIFEGNNVPIFHLAELFNEPMNLTTLTPVVIVSHAGHSLAIGVDQLLSTEEIVVKPLHRAVKVNRLFSGSALIGSGEVVLILDIAQLISYDKPMHERRIFNAF